MNGRPDFTVAFPKIDKEGRTHWKQVGVAFKQRNGHGITVMLDSLPMPQTPWDGVLSLYPIREDNFGKS
jgi:hypothetical protein